MTCCVAVEHRGRVLVAADSFFGNDDERGVYRGRKFWRTGGLAVAFAGDIKGPDLARARLRPRRRRGEDTRAYVTRYAAALRALHKAEHVPFRDCRYIIACDGAAYVVQNDASVARTRAGYCAIGHGYKYALGSLHSTAGLPVVARARKALRAAAAHSPAVIPPLRWTLV